MIFNFLSYLETVHDTVQYSYCFFLSLLNLLFRIRLKCQNPLLSYVRERERGREREREGRRKREREGGRERESTL